MNNKAILTGKIINKEFSHKVKEKTFLKLTVASTRMSGTIDLVPVIIEEEKVFPEIQSLKIIGEARTINLDKQLKVFIFAKSIEPLMGFNSMDINEIELEGTICKPVNKRETPKKRKIADILLAVNGNHKKSYYFPCLAWGKLANLSQSLEVGDKVNLKGRFQSRIYLKGEEEKTTYEISISNLIPLVE